MATALAPATASATAVLHWRTITINSGQVPSTQTNFPVLVSLSDATLKSVSNGGHVSSSTGSDIYFTDAGNTAQYSCEIESYDSTNGTLVAWVKVPSLTDGTVIKMWYGIASSTPNTPSNVWDSNFKGVWHMNQVNALDSTANGNNGTVVNGSLSSVSGQIGGADGFTNTPAASGYIDCGNGSSLNFSASGVYTWTAWVNTTGATGGGCGIIGKATGSGYDIYLKNGNGITIQDGVGGSSASQVASVGAVPSSNAWHQIAITYNNQAVSIYLDGTLNNSASLSGLADNNLSHVFIGYRASHTNGNGIFNGSIDEVRYSTTVRSADWITTEYRNQNAPGSFYTLSGEDGTSPTPTPTLTPTPTPTATPTPSWDLNGDHTCNIGDVVKIGLQWGRSGSGWWIPEDVNGDGVINIGDVVVIGLHWGQSW